MTRVRALRGLEYPESREIRDRIHHSRNHQYAGDRGTIVRVEEGQVFEAPEDILEYLLNKNLAATYEPQPQGGDQDG